MSRNICKDKDEFYRLMFNALKNNGADNYCNSEEIYELLEPYKTFDELPADLRYGFMECQSSNSDSALEELVHIIEKRVVTWEGKTHYEQVGLNIYSQYWDESYITSSHEGLSGFHQLPTGEVFYAYEGHLDCNETFNIIIYAEDGVLKLYAPEKGNVYDARYMCAFDAEGDVYERCGDTKERRYEKEDTDDMKCNPELELADIADYFQNRKEGEHAKGLKDFNPQFQPQTLEWNLKHKRNPHKVDGGKGRPCKADKTEKPVKQTKPAPSAKQPAKPVASSKSSAFKAFERKSALEGKVFKVTMPYSEIVDKYNALVKYVRANFQKKDWEGVECLDPELFICHNFEEWVHGLSFSKVHELTESFLKGEFDCRLDGWYQFVENEKYFEPGSESPEECADEICFIRDGKKKGLFVIQRPDMESLLDEIKTDENGSFDKGSVMVFIDRHRGQNTDFGWKDPKSIPVKVKGWNVPIVPRDMTESEYDELQELADKFNWYAVNSNWCSTAYVLDKNGIRKILERLDDDDTEKWNTDSEPPRNSKNIFISLLTEEWERHQEGDSQDFITLCGGGEEDEGTVAIYSKEELVKKIDEFKDEDEDDDDDDDDDEEPTTDLDDDDDKDDGEDHTIIKLDIEDFAQKYTDKIKELANNGMGGAVTITPEIRKWGEEALKTIDKIKRGEVIPVDKDGNEITLEDVRKRILGDEYNEDDDDDDDDEWTGSPEDLAEAERQVGVCIGLMKQEEARKQRQEEEKEEDKVKKEIKTKNVFYSVTMNLWAVRNGRHGAESTVTPHGSSSYHNVFKTYEEALEYAHLLMMINHGGRTHDWDKFLKTIEMVEGDGFPTTTSGYRHFAMKDGTERFEGFDLSAQFPCIVDDITIMKRNYMSFKMDYTDKKNPKVEAVELQPMKKEYYMKADPLSEFTEEQHETNQKFVDDLADELGGVEGLCDDDKFARKDEPVAESKEEEGDDFDEIMKTLKKNEKKGGDI